MWFPPRTEYAEEASKEAIYLSADGRATTIEEAKMTLKEYNAEFLRTYTALCLYAMLRDGHVARWRDGHTCVLLAVQPPMARGTASRTSSWNYM